MSLSIGDVIEGKYRIVRLLGEGGMGAVYEGENVRIHRRVAIKVLHAGIAASQDAVQRFEREAQAAGRIGSEHIVEVLDLGNLPSGDRFMVMEFMDGQPLSARIKGRGRLSPRELYPVARQILEGLAAAHGAGIIHRDLKPDNVYLLRNRGGQADFVKLLDFGISKFSRLSGDSGFSMTRTGAVMGTPYYMSPEQAKGAKGLDQRADLYAVGVILYESITGRVPFDADTFNELLFKIVLETPPAIEQVAPDCDPGFAAIVQKAMARDPNDRHQTAQDFQAALDAWGAQLGAAPQAVPVAAAPKVLTSSPPEAAPSPPAAPDVAAAGSLKGTGTAGSWSNTAGSLGDVPRASKNKTALIAATGAGILLFAGIGFAVLRLASAGDVPAPSASAASAGPSMEEAAKAAAAEAAQRAAEQTRKAAEEELQAAEQKAKEAEERAKQAQASLDKKQAEQEAQRQRDNVTRLRAAAAAPHPVATATAVKRDTKPASSPTAPAPTTTGRKIRTEL